MCTVQGYIQTSSVQKCIYSRKSKKPASGGQTEAVPPEWEKQGSHRLIIGLIRDGYRLPFRERSNLSRVPCIVSSYAGFDKQNALWTSIQDLRQKGTVEVVHTTGSLVFYSCLSWPSQSSRWRPQTPHLTQERGMGHIYRSHRRLPTYTYSDPVSEVPQVLFQMRHLPVHQPTFQACNSPLHFHQYSQ